MDSPGFDWQRGTLHDAKIWAVQWSAYDPDASHPHHVRDLLRTPWPSSMKTLARTLPSVDAFVIRREVDALARAKVAAANASAARVAAPTVQLGLVLDDTVPDTDDCSASPSELMRMLSHAYVALGRVPTMRDVQRRREGLPDIAEFDHVGGFRAAVNRWRAETGAVA